MAPTTTIPQDIPTFLTATSGSFSFYTHETNLLDKVKPAFSIHSNSLPLLLRNVTADDAPDLLEHYSDNRNVGLDKSVAHLNTLPAVEELITTLSTFTNPLTQVSALIFENDKFIGSGGLGWIGVRADGTRIGDAGIMLNSEARGKGYAYEALRITFDYGFQVLGLDEVHLATKNENVAMRGLMDKKFGFEAKPINDAKFGNDWIWKISKRQWFDCVHSK